MHCDLPAGSLVWQQIHVQYLSAFTRAEHCSLFLKSILLDNVEGPPTHFSRKAVVHNFGAVWWIKPANNSLGPRPNDLSNGCHVERLSASSIIRSNGRTSPIPTDRLKIEQMPSSGSQMISMLARLKVTEA